MRSLILHILAAILGLWLATIFVDGVRLVGLWQFLIYAGIILGIVNYFLKPLLKAATWPLRILTLGLFNLVINIFLVWLVVDVIFPEIEIEGLLPLFWTAVIIWALGLLLRALSPKKAANQPVPATQ